MDLCTHFLDIGFSFQFDVTYRALETDGSRRQATGDLCVLTDEMYAMRLTGPAIDDVGGGSSGAMDSKKRKLTRYSRSIEV
jgi:hypothetical protein